jgi:hypothetical protein
VGDGEVVGWRGGGVEKGVEVVVVDVGGREVK